MIEVDDRVEIGVDTTVIERIIDKMSDRVVEIVICDEAQMRDLNCKHRHIDRSTDVLSFSYGDLPMTPLGSIVVCERHIKEQAQAHAHTLDDEFTLLCIHGFLHLLGYDHECDENQMRRLEQKIIEQYGLPQSLIVRSKKEQD